MTTAKDVLAALRAKHAGDVFVSECNLGSAWEGCRRMDAWAMKRSWKPLTAVGYEIKVSRSDFLNDDKWREYIGFAHEIWFVCPWELIAPAELPTGVGLMWLNKGGKLVRKRKAVRYTGNTSKIVDAMAYILMSRSKIVPPGTGHEERPVTVEDWQAWLEGKERNAVIGRKVQKEINKRCYDLEYENLQLKRENESFDKLRAKLRELGFDPEHTSHWNIESQIDRLRGIVSPRTIGSVMRTSQTLRDLADELEAMRAGTP